MSEVRITATLPDGTPIANWRTRESGEHYVVLPGPTIQDLITEAFVRRKEAADREERGTESEKSAAHWIAARAEHELRVAVQKLEQERDALRIENQRHQAALQTIANWFIECNAKMTHLPGEQP